MPRNLFFTFNPWLHLWKVSLGSGKKRSSWFSSWELLTKTSMCSSSGIYNNLVTTLASKPCRGYRRQWAGYCRPIHSRELSCIFSIQKAKSSKGSSYKQVKCLINLGTKACSIVSTHGSSTLLEQTSLGLLAEDGHLYCIFIKDELTFIWSNWKDRS